MSDPEFMRIVTDPIRDLVAGLRVRAKAANGPPRRIMYYAGFEAGMLAAADELEAVMAVPSRDEDETKAVCWDSFVKMCGEFGFVGPYRGGIVRWAQDNIALLRRLEWVSGACPACRIECFDHPRPLHMPTCELAALLAQQDIGREGPTSETPMPASTRIIGESEAERCGE